MKEKVPYKQSLPLIDFYVCLFYYKKEYTDKK